MDLINSLPELINNTLYLESKLKSENLIEKTKAISLIKRGTCFIRYIADDRILFAPSRFVGYKGNSIEMHLERMPHGSVTNSRIEKILQKLPLKSEIFDQEYRAFCNSYQIIPNSKGNFGADRKFWNLSEIPTNVYGEAESPEGRKKYVTHLLRERNPRIRQIAINNFLAKHSKLYCEICKFSFQRKYGEIGKNFIECHHTIPLSKMMPGHKTKPEDFLMVCSNCHRMIHSGEGWLRGDQLQEIIKEKRLLASKKPDAM